MSRVQRRYMLPSWTNTWVAARSSTGRCRATSRLGSGAISKMVSCESKKGAGAGGGKKQNLPPWLTHTHTHQLQSSGDMAYNSNPSVWNHYNTNNTFFCWGLAKKTYFFSPQLNSLRLVIMFYTTVICYFKLNKNACRCFCIHPAPWTAVFYCTWTLFFAPSSATRRAGRPRVLTTLTQTPTVSCACCMSKGGRTSPRPRYGEQGIKGPVKD